MISYKAISFNTVVTDGNGDHDMLSVDCLCEYKPYE